MVGKHVVLSVLALAAFGAFADDQPASAPTSAPADIEPAQFAAQQKALLERLTDLRFDVQVFEEATKPDGRVSPRQEVARAKVLMTRGRIRTEVCVGKGTDPAFALVDDGTKVTEWTPAEWCEYPSPPTEASRSIELRGSFTLGCQVGSYLASWLGPGAGHSRWLGRVLADSNYRGLQELNGSQCDMLEYESVDDADHFLVNHKLWIDRKSQFLVQWATRQAQLSGTGKVIWEITRTRAYGNFDTASIPAETFIVRPPRGAVRRGAASQCSSRPTTTSTAAEPSANARQD